MTETPRIIDSPHPHSDRAQLDRFYVVTTVSNAARFKRRYELYKRFEDLCAQAGVMLITVEQAFGLRHYVVTQPNNRYHVQVRTVEELWHKENMAEIGFQRARELGAREVALVDCDIRPAGPVREWFEETWHWLQHYEIVQMGSWLQNVDLKNQPLGSAGPGFIYNYIRRGHPAFLKEALRIDDKLPIGYPYYGRGRVWGWPGLCWAYNVDALDKIGGLIDFAILGPNDWYMACGLVGLMHIAVRTNASSNFIDKLMHWQELCERWIKRDVGYVPGLILHDFHGAKKNRYYDARGQILVETKFDPDKDCKYDSQGLLQLETWTPDQILLRDYIRAYFHARNEDSTTEGEGW